jgi:hypothetical protein
MVHGILSFTNWYLNFTTGNQNLMIWRMGVLAQVDKPAAEIDEIFICSHFLWFLWVAAPTGVTWAGRFWALFSAVYSVTWYPNAKWAKHSECCSCEANFYVTRSTSRICMDSNGCEEIMHWEYSRPRFICTILKSLNMHWGHFLIIWQKSYVFAPNEAWYCQLVPLKVLFKSFPMNVCFGIV